MRHRRPLIVLSLLLGCATTKPTSPTGPVNGRMTDAEWRADLDALSKGLEELHANAFHAIDRERFGTLKSAVEQRIASREPNAIVVGMMRLVASVGDGHTLMVALPTSRVRAHSYGFRMALFRDGLFVIATRKELAHLAGSRVIRIGSVTAEDALDRVGDIVPGDNGSDRRFRVPFYLAIPEVLHGLGIEESAARMTLEVKNRSGKRIAVTIEAEEASPCFPRLPCSLERTLPPGWIDARDGWASPVSRDDGPAHVRSAVLAGGTVLYVELKEILDAEETLQTSWRRALESAPQARHLILDLRRNHGGDNTLCDGLLEELARYPAFSKPKGLFVLAGPETFSAAQNLATRLDRSTAAIFVGEPSGGRPNHYGDATKILLPHSGWGATASTRYWEDAGPGDVRDSIVPDEEVAPSFEDFRLGRDVTVDAALRQAIK